MKKIIVILGANAVGKSSAANKIVELYKCAFVDSDWCRIMNPFKLTRITKETVTNNIYCLLRNYLNCEEIDTVIFTHSWHGERKEIYDKVIELLKNDGIEFHEKIIILKCDESENKRRALADGRDMERIERGMKNTFLFYDQFDYPCIDTTHMTVAEVAEQIWKLAN